VLAADGNRVVVQELRMTRFDAELATNQAFVFLFAIAMNHVVFLCDQFTKIELHLRRGEARIARIPRIMNDFRRLDQILRGHAAAVDARAAGHAFLGHHRGFAKFLRAQRRGKRGGAGANDNQVIMGLSHKIVADDK
jgi:hypothetical protein